MRSVGRSTTVKPKICTSIFVSSSRTPRAFHHALGGIGLDVASAAVRPRVVGLLKLFGHGPLRYNPRHAEGGNCTLRDSDLIANIRQIGAGAEKHRHLTEEERQVEALGEISRTHVELAIRFRQAQSEIERARIGGQIETLSEVEAQTRRQFMRLIKK